MSLELYSHPLASFCHKVLIALYENETPFEGRLVNFGDEAERAKFFALAPIGKMPVLHDTARDRVVPETSIIIEYLDRYYPGARPLLPGDETERLDARLWDRFFDLYVHAPMQAIVGDRLRQEGERDPRGVADAVAALEKAYAIIERQLAGKSWAIGEAFSIADCAAAPALFYAAIVAPFPPEHQNLAGYFERLMARPSVARTVEEARPYFHMYPFRDRMPARFLGEAAAGA
jgi:glutathione S-transferase